MHAYAQIWTIIQNTAGFAAVSKSNCFPLAVFPLRNKDSFNCTLCRRAVQRISNKSFAWNARHISGVHIIVLLFGGVSVSDRCLYRLADALRLLRAPCRIGLTSPECFTVDAGYTVHTTHHDGSWVVEPSRWLLLVRGMLFRRLFVLRRRCCGSAAT